jgi:hypothetical protein
MSTTTTTAGKGIRTSITRPAPDADPRPVGPQRTVGLALATGGLLLVVVAAIATWGTVSPLGEGGAVTSTLAWTFAVTITGFGLAKLGIATTLVGIVLRLWHRANAVASELPRLRTSEAGLPELLGPVETEQGPATATATPPAPLLIHRMASALWLPVLVMGAMALAAGLVIGLVAADAAAGSETFRRLSAWSQGTLFLGEGLLLSGISFLLGTILASLRQAGGEIQSSLGAAVKTLHMPTAAKAFIVLMAAGMMMAIAQFVLYVAAASDAADPASFAVWSTWLGPFRETALGVLLAGIVLALFAISKVLAFQFTRITELVRPVG